MIEYNDIEKMLSQSALSEYELPENKKTLKNVLINLNCRHRKKIRTRLLQTAGVLSGCFSVVLAFFLVIENNNQPGPANNLGGVWSTFSDSSQGGSSTVWPPVSTSCQNLFEKSSPGYGNKGYAVRIKGKTGTTGTPFLGVNTYLSPRASCPRCIGIDLRMYRGIRFKMKGTAGKGNLFFILPHESRKALPDHSSCVNLTDYHDYQTEITRFVKNEWTDVKLFFRKDFKQPSGTPDSLKVKIETVLEDENKIQWRWIGKQKQRIDLWIDNVELF